MYICKCTLRMHSKGNYGQPSEIPTSLVTEDLYSCESGCKEEANEQH